MTCLLIMDLLGLIYYIGYIIQSVFSEYICIYIYIYIYIRIHTDRGCTVLNSADHGSSVPSYNKHQVKILLLII